MSVASAPLPGFIQQQIEFVGMRKDAFDEDSQEAFKGAVVFCIAAEISTAIDNSRVEIRSVVEAGGAIAVVYRVELKKAGFEERNQTAAVTSLGVLLSRVVQDGDVAVNFRKE